MAIETSRYDAADYLKTEEDITNYLNSVLELNEPEVFAKAIGDVARAHGMAKVAKSTGLKRETLYRSLSSKGNPQLDSLMKVLGAIGMRLSIVTANIAQRPMRTQKSKPARTTTRRRSA